VLVYVNVNCIVGGRAANVNRAARRRRSLLLP
jgi:hypothetical protein